MFGLLLTQMFSPWFIVLSFKINQDYIASKKCENRFRPQLKCKGNCVLMKKLKQQEEEDKDNPGSRVELLSIVLSSKCFFASIEAPLVRIIEFNLAVLTAGKPVDRSAAIFHPPSA